jgi:hypothetical protein
MIKWQHCAISLALAAIPPASAAADDARSPATAGCELHVWPAVRMESATSTILFGGGLVDAKMHSAVDASNAGNMANALDSATQLGALISMGMPGLLGLPADTKVIGHEESLDRKTIRKIKTRRSGSTASCYYEVIVQDVMFTKSPIYGRSLRTDFMFRNFGDDQVIDRQLTAPGGNAIKLFPPLPGEDTTAALQELVDVFKKNFDEYARSVRAGAQPLNR